MKHPICGKRAQSVTEYAILLGVAIAVFAGMQTYIKRGFQAKLKVSTDAMSKAGANQVIHVGAGSSETINLGNLSQYEPYYTYQTGDTYSESKAGEYLTGDGNFTKTNNEMSVQAAGSISAQRIANSTAAYTGVWR
jgi:hypothetical protein